MGIELGAMKWRWVWKRTGEAQTAVTAKGLWMPRSRSPGGYKGIKPSNVHKNTLFHSGILPTK